MPSIEGRMIDPETGKDVPTGQPGEVWVRGPKVMKGYLNNPEATALTVDADGWLHTGDIGVMDDDGYLTVVDRLKELIKVKGFQVAPAELESLLLKHPKIADVAVIPVADEDCGEVPKAIVVKREPLTAEEVIAFLEPKVAHYKRVRHVAFVDAIPKSPSGKILRRVLVEKERLASPSLRATAPSLTVSRCQSFVAQHRRRLHAHRAPRRHRARQQRDRQHQRTTSGERARIGGADAEQQARHQSRRRQAPAPMPTINADRRPPSCPGRSRAARRRRGCRRAPCGC